MTTTSDITSQKDCGRVQKIENQRLVVFIANGGNAAEPSYFLQAVEFKTPMGNQRILEGIEGKEFATSLGSAGASQCEIKKTYDGGYEIQLSGKGEGWEASGTISLPANQAILRRKQTYRFLQACDAAVHPGFRIKASENIRYTFPMRTHEQALAGLPPLRAAVDWALPFPFHVWHDGDYVALYGVERSASAGTLDFLPVESGAATVRVYYPDSCPQPHPWQRTNPETTSFAAGAEVTLNEVFSAKTLAAGEEPLLEAERIGAEILLGNSHPADFEAVAARAVRFYHRCELWDKDALGEGRGWFRNMWVRTHTGPAKKEGEWSGYYDFGWGEGIAVEMFMGVVRNWKRTGDTSLLPYVDEMSRNMELFKRGPEPDAPYFDRSDGKKYGDFMKDHTPGIRIWTHCLAHNGSQLIQLYQLAPDYPNAETRRLWLATATSIGNFLAKHQKPDGDVQDIFDENDKEVNTKSLRIAARAVTCGLWTRLGQVTGDKAWIERASRLAKFMGPEIGRYEITNQMCDGIAIEKANITDGEGAYYVLEGLAPLYAETRNPEVLAMCQKAAAFGFAWTYFFDLPLANKGIARGGQCCRMEDTPLLYPIGSAKAMEPVLSLAETTDDPFYEKMAEEAASFIGNWQMEAPGQPFDGGFIHALGQYCGKHWGPDLAGQVDTGMATGNSLAAIELWMAYKRKHAH